MEANTQSRRSAVKSIAWLAAGAAGLWRFLTPRRSANTAASAISVRSDDVPANGALVLPQHGIAVVREGTALHALDLVCTHLGCTVGATAGGFACSCHGSRFSCSGERLSGPAPRALRRLHVEELGGVIEVAANQAPDSEEES